MKLITPVLAGLAAATLSLNAQTTQTTTQQSTATTPSTAATAPQGTTTTHQGTATTAQATTTTPSATATAPSATTTMPVPTPSTPSATVSAPSATVTTPSATVATPPATVTTPSASATTSATTVTPSGTVQEPAGAATVTTPGATAPTPEQTTTTTITAQPTTPPPGHPIAGYVAQEDKWIDAPPVLAGAQMMVLSGDITKAGPYTIRLRLPAGYHVPLHWNDSDVNMTVISGVLHIGFAPNFNSTNSKEIGPLSFAMIPARMKHTEWVDVDTIVQVHGLGPLNFHEAYPNATVRVIQ